MRLQSYSLPFLPLPALFSLGHPFLYVPPPYSGRRLPRLSPFTAPVSFLAFPFVFPRLPNLRFRSPVAPESVFTYSHLALLAPPWCTLCSPRWFPLPYPSPPLPPSFRSGPLRGSRCSTRPTEALSRAIDSPCPWSFAVACYIPPPAHFTSGAFSRGALPPRCCCPTPFRFSGPCGRVITDIPAFRPTPRDSGRFTVSRPHAPCWFLPFPYHSWPWTHITRRASTWSCLRLPPSLRRSHLQVHITSFHITPQPSLALSLGPPGGWFPTCPWRCPFCLPGRFFWFLGSSWSTPGPHSPHFPSYDCPTLHSPSSGGSLHSTLRLSPPASTTARRCFGCRAHALFLSIIIFPLSPLCALPRRRAFWSASLQRLDCTTLLLTNTSSSDLGAAHTAFPPITARQSPRATATSLTTLAPPPTHTPDSARDPHSSSLSC